VKTRLQGIERELALEFISQLDYTLCSFEELRLALRRIYFAPDITSAALDIMPGEDWEEQFHDALWLCIHSAVSLVEGKRAGGQPTGRTVISVDGSNYKATAVVVWDPYSPNRKCVLFREFRASELVGHDGVAGLVRTLIKPIYDEIVRSLDPSGSTTGSRT